jgi:hypothetical protein
MGHAVTSGEPIPATTLRLIRFATKGIAFAALGAVILNAISAVLLRHESIVSGLGIASEARHVYEAAFRSEQPSTSPIVLVGDSVATQIVREAADAAKGVEPLTTYYTISMVGQYLLVQNALRHNRSVREVRLLYIPGSFSNDLDGALLYPHLVRPLMDRGAIGGLSPYAEARLRRSPWFPAYGLPISRASAWFPTFDYSADPLLSPIRHRGNMAPVSIEYLKRIVDLCHAHGARFRVYSPPVCRCRLSDLGAMSAVIDENGLRTEFSSYFDTLRVLDSASFLPDQVHLPPAMLREQAHLYHWWWDTGRPAEGAP